MEGKNEDENWQEAQSADPEGISSDEISIDKESLDSIEKLPLQ